MKLIALMLLCATPDPLGLMKDSDRRHRLEGEILDVELILAGKDGGQKTQLGRMARAQDLSEAIGDRMWFHFTAPSDVDGTTLLSVESKSGGADQWLYLPAFRRVRRLGSSELGDRFAETDFFYEDLKRRVVENYSYELLGTEAIAGESYYVLSSKPIDPTTIEQSPYAKSKVWMRAKDLFIAKVQHFDRSMRPWKELRFEEPREVSKGVVRADRIVVTDVRRKHQSVILVRKRTVGRNIPERWLSSNTFHE